MDFQSTALQLIRSQIAATRSGNPHLARYEIRSILANSEPIKMLATDIARLNEAASDVHPSPTDAQKEALNFKQGHFSWKGIPITIETAKGTYRRGVSKDGKPWKCLMQRAHYGRIKRSEGADGENIDVFLCDGRGQGESLDSDVVFVVNQVDPSGKFDEHKFILGCASKSAAKAVYLAAYPSNWNGCGSIVALTVPQFKKWLEHGKTSRAIGEVDGIAMLASPPKQNGEPTAHADYPTMLIAYLDALVDAESGDEESNEVADELHGMMFGGNQENNEGSQVDPETIKTLSSLPDGVSLVMLDTQPQVNDGQQTQWQRLPRNSESPISGRTIHSDQAWYNPTTRTIVYGKDKTGRQRTSQQSARQQPVQKQLETPEDQAAFQANKSIQADRAHEIGQAIAAHARGEIDTAPTVKDYRELINLMPHLDMKQRVSIRNTVLSAFGENAAQKEVLANALREHVKAKIAKMGLDNADDPIAHATGSAFGKDELKIQRQSGKRERYGSTQQLPPPPPPTSSPSGKTQSGPSADAVVHAAERVTNAKTLEEQKSAIEDLKHIREAHVAAKQDMRANADLDAFMDEPVPQEQLDEIKQRNEREGRIPPPVQKQEPIPQPPSTIPSQSATSLDRKLPSVKSPWEMTPEEFKKSGHKVFRTTAGSLYAAHPETGQTTRIKAGRDGVGHEGDTGLKTPSTKTVYVPNNSAGGLSSAGITGPDGKPPKSRVIIKDGKASLLTWNEKENRWGVAPSGKDIQVHDKPGIGLQPLELWHPKDDVYGHEAYSNMHAGNAITSIEDPNEEHHKAFVDAARAVGKQIPEIVTDAQQSLSQPNGQLPTTIESSKSHVQEPDIEYQDRKAGKGSEVANNVFGDASEQDRRNLMLAAPGAKTVVGALGKNIVAATTTHPDYKSVRYFERKPNGELIIHNVSLDVTDTGKGVGAGLFKNQVDSAIKAGASKIKTSATGSSKKIGNQEADKKNGYYVWPKFGYNGEIPSDVNLPPKFQDAKSILDLYQIPGGQEWWKENGVSLPLEFDLKDGSRSRQTLDSYLKKKAASRDEFGDKKSVAIDKPNGPLPKSPDATSLRDLQEQQNRFTPVEGNGGDASVDQIEGGLADNIQPSSFDKASVEKGASVEKEHTSDPDKAAEIARDHLSEDPKYYEKLAAMEKGSIRPRAETAKSNYERTNPGKSFDAEFSGAGPERKQQLLDAHAPNHHLDVQDALEAGKEVPPEVLAEYPKLAKKYGKEVAKLNVSQSEGVFDPKLKPEQPANIDNPEPLSPEVQKKREPVEREKKAKAKKESAAKLIKAEARERVKRHNEQADRHNKMLREAVEMLNIGKRGKDFIRAGGKEHEDAASMEQYGIDQVARSLASEYPDLLGGPGYRTDAISGEEPDYAGKLYELLSAGKKHRLTNAEAERSLFEEHANIAGEHGQDNAWKFLREQAQKTRDRHADSHITSEGELHKEINNARVHAPESEISEAVRGSEEEANSEEPIDPAREDSEDVRRDAESGGGQDSGDSGDISFDPSEFDSISFDPSEFDQQQEDVAPSSQQTPETVQPKQEQSAPEPKKEDHPFDEAISRAAKKKADDAAKAREEKKKANDPRGKLAAAVSAGNQDEAIDHLGKLTLREQREELEKIGVPDGGKAKSKMQATAMLRKHLGGGVVKEDDQKQEPKTGDELKQAVLDHIRDNPNVSTGDLRHAMNHKDFDKEDPLANPVHKALRELRDEGKVDVESPRFGDARAKIKEQPKQSDKPLPHIPRVTNEEFANGDWDQAHAGLGSEIVTAKMAEGMKGIDGREYGIREHSPGKWQLVSKIDKNAKSEADKKQELDSQQQLAPHHKEIFDSLSKTMDRQLADTSSVNRKLIIATGLMQGEPPAVQAALAKHLKENHRDAFDSGVANKQRVPLAMREHFKSPVPPGVDPSHAPIVEAIQKLGGPDELTVNNIEELRRKFYSGAKTPTPAKIREIAEAMKQSNFGVDSESGKQKPERRPMMLPFDEQDEQKQKDHHAAIPDLQKRLGWMDQQNYDKVNEHIGDAHDSMSVPEFRDYASKLTGIRFTNESRKKVMDTLKNMMEALSRTHLQVQGIGGRPADKPEHLKTDDEKVEPEKKEQPNLSEQLSSIPQGDRSRVNGFMVQRQGPDAYRIEKQSGKGYVSGTAAEINDYIDRELKNQKAYGKQLPEALARAAAFTEPHWTDIKGTEQAEKGFNALPKGTPVVSLDEHAGTHGRTGQIVKDEQGRNRVKLDGEDGYATNHVEPLNKALSWRNKQGESGSSEPPPPKMSQGSLFAREADGTVKVAVPQSELADSPHHATVDKWLSHSDNSHLNPERRKMIGDSIKTTISRMHPKAADLALANMSSHPRLYNSTSDLTDSYNEILKSEGENPLEPGHEIGGYYQLDDEGHTGVAYLDYSQHEDEADAIWCHAHELHHAIDGFNTLSGTPEWDAAWRKEIRRSMDWDNHPLTRYASTKPWEGFAEFGAALVCDPDSSREMFPECYQFFKSKGLI